PLIRDEPFLLQLKPVYFLYKQCVIQFVSWVVIFKSELLQICAGYIFGMDSKPMISLRKW
uniref:hypothetical protein n=1 Tax=Shewanella sp. ECSMB14101 TaxID=1565129 RepID=UPI001F300297